MNRRLYRSRTDTVLGGVAAGVAEYLDVDPAIVRIIWAILAIATGGIFVLVYIVMWVVVPEAPRGAGMPPPGAATSAPPGASEAGTGAAAAATDSQWVQPDTRQRGSARRGSTIFGLLLIGIGLYFLARNWLPQVEFDRFWPLVLILLGALLLLSALRRPAE